MIKTNESLANSIRNLILFLLVVSVLFMFSFHKWLSILSVSEHPLLLLTLTGGLVVAGFGYFIDKIN